MLTQAESRAPSGVVCSLRRDVKGDNVVVRLSDRRAVLIDFGSCHFEGAQRLTWESLPPVTQEYLSPQARQFYIHSLWHPDGYYPPSAADDLYALGVTAYRLVMGQYPAREGAKQDEEGGWRVTSPDPRPQLESNPKVEPLLREVLVRLLSDEPEARGTAGQVAEALEAAAGEEELPEPTKPPERVGAWKHWLALGAAAACAVLLWHWRPVTPPGASVSMPRASDSRTPEAGTATVGDTSPAEPQAAPVPATEEKPPAQETLPEPSPGQARPDKRGQCPGSKQVSIKGGCWVRSSMAAQECVENGGVLFQGKCFSPALAPPKKPQPTSSPMEAR